MDVHAQPRSEVGSLVKRKNSHARKPAACIGADPYAGHGALSLRTKLLKVVVPGSMRRALKAGRRFWALARSTGYDFWRFVRFSSFVFQRDGEAKELGYITKYYHCIEKGLSLRHPRPGFGAGVVNELVERIEAFLKSRGPSPLLAPSLSALKSYIEFNRSHGIERSDLETRVRDLETVFARGLGSLPAGRGFLDVSREEVIKATSGVGADFFLRRHSIRQFGKENASLSQIEEAVRLAQKAPSVCNRQSGRVWLIVSPEKVAKVLEIQAGARGFAEEIDKVAVVTSEISSFQTCDERNQGWIDGALFGMSLVYALHAKGLATCCLNWCASVDRDKRLKHLLDMPQSHSVIMVVAIGTLPETLRVAESRRLPLQEVLTVV